MTGGADAYDGRVPVFCNLASGRAAMEDRLLTAVANAGVAVALHRTPPEALASAIRGAVAAGAPIVAVAGGDGSVATAAQVLVDTPTVLAVIPSGTLNHFAHALGIHDHESAARALASRSVAAVDIGDVNGRVFVNGVSFGLYPRTLRLRREWEPRFGKRPAAMLAAIRAVADYPDGQIWRHMTSDLEARHPLVWVGAGRGSFRSPRTSPRELDSGVLELVVLATRVRTQMLRLAWRAVRRGLDGLDACRHRFLQGSVCLRAHPLRIAPCFAGRRNGWRAGSPVPAPALPNTIESPSRDQAGVMRHSVAEILLAAHGAPARVTTASS